MKNLQKRVELFGILEKLSYLSHGNHTSGRGTLCMRNYQIFQQLFSENLQISFIFENCHF